MRILLLALAVSAMGCGLTSYEKAAGQFGSATAAAVTATRSVVGSAHETCRFRAALHLVEARFQAPEFVRGTDAMALSSGVSTADGKGKLTWGEYCQQLTDYDRALIGALSALDAYASTLKSVAVGDGAAIQTGVAGALAADAGDLGNSLGASSLAKAKDLSGPVTDLANVVLDLIRTKKLKDAIRRGSGPVHSVLRGWDEYLGAAKLQLGDAERLRKQLVRNADAIIPVRGEGEALPLRIRATGTGPGPVDDGRDREHREARGGACGGARGAGERDRSGRDRRGRSGVRGEEGAGNHEAGQRTPGAQRERVGHVREGRCAPDPLRGEG